ncbi:hypothetical protein VNO77_19908 [Canavalia gladiata]|uniref:Uncharacterized protein n=1 Tax=Canavalia gladiata TaxID=3824 RepID=A0AAN9LNH1_CANGL
MDHVACVSSRTRSKKALNFLNLAYIGSSSSESKCGMSDRRGLMSEPRKRKRKLEKRVRVDDDVVFMGEEGKESASLKIESKSIASSSSSSRGLKGKTAAKPDFVCLGEREDEECFDVINLDDSDDDDDEAEEGLGNSKKKRFKVEDVDIHLKEEEKSEERGKGYVFGDKVANFGNEDYDSRPENTIIITIDSDGESENEIQSSSGDESDSVLSSPESEDEETSDEDFHVDDGSEDRSSENSGCSDDDDDDDDEDERENLRRKYNKTMKEQVIKVETESNEIYRKKYERKNKHVEKEEEEEEEEDNNCARARVAFNECEIRDEEKRREEKHVEEEDKNNCASVTSNECEIPEEEEKREEKTVENVHSEVKIVADYRENLECSMPSEDEALKDKTTQDKGHQSVSLQKETGDSNKVKNKVKNNDTIAETNVCVNPDAHEGKEHHHDKGTGDSTMVKNGEKNEDANAIDCVNPDPHEDKEHHQDKGTGVRNVSSLPKVQEKIGDSVEVISKENKKERKHKHLFNSDNREKKVRVEDNENGFIDERHKVHMMSSRTKEQRLIKLLAECFWGKNDSVKDVSNELEENDDDDDVPQCETQPPACRETIPLTCSLMKKEPIEKSESEKELDRLWEEMEMLLKLEEANSQVGNIGTNESRANEGEPASLCKHDFYLDEQIGILCRFCLWVSTEIKFVMPPFAEKYCSEGSGRRVSSGGVNITCFDGAQFNDFGGDSEAVWSLNEGTVWDLIPDIKQSLYPHQQEGFEFIWSRLAGTIDLQTLKKVDPCSEGGCIISHAPGTGKTRLTMVFLQTYMQVFPKCLPVIIAPANLLLTWEDELRKWEIGIPFHNFNNHELSGNEHMDAANNIDLSGNSKLNKDAIRMVKLCSWYKEKSILLISYPLYEKLAGGMSEVDVEKEKKNWNMKKKKKRVRHRQIIESQMGKVLRDWPGLLVLDEGHTPRNQRSCIWKVLSESRTQKRILLSGTPFQNNFLELYNILCLMKPSFPDSIPQELKKFCQSRLMQANKASKDLSWESVSSGNPADTKINQLKLLMDPFVHVHKGSILQKNLPGLRDCVLILKPDSLQKEILESIDSSQNILNFEHKLALVSVHPSLFLKCALIEKEESIIDKDRLEKLRLDPYGGVKTKFLMEFVRLCDAYNEKVLVFSQYIDTLCLIKDQLESSFKWSEGNEVLYMYGRLDQKQKQSVIHNFNNANSHVKILLASIKACSEGINLIGASRVVLLDVVWNPSVERQAICRAYRIGQKKVVYTYHLLSQGTPECAKYSKQAEKDRLSELVFSDKNTANDKLKNCTVTLEDAVLDRMIQHEKLKDMFGECLVQPKERVLEGFGL